VELLETLVDVDVEAGARVSGGRGQLHLVLRAGDCATSKIERVFSLALVQLRALDGATASAW